MTEGFEEVNPTQVQEIATRLLTAHARGGTVFLMGNGGSASTASHIANDLHAAGIKAISLCDNIALLTSIANDFSYKGIFVKQLLRMLTSNDLVIVISGSGNSENIIRAVEFANRVGALTIGLLGFGGGKLKDIVKDGIVLQSQNYGVVESTHLLILHRVADIIKEKLWE